MDRNYPRVKQSTLHYMAYKIDPRQKLKKRLTTLDLVDIMTGWIGV